MDPLAIGLAFLLGFAARQARLPPLVGFLCAGFVLHAAGLEGGETIREVADLGVTLLLFTIGLKLRIKSLMRPEIWAGTTIHMAITVVVLGLAAFALSGLGVATFAGLGLGTAFLVAFALSFSSTVFAVKVLEDKGEIASLHARTAIGILIVQDLIAVAFLTFAGGTLPSPWAFALLGLPLLRPILGLIMDRCGHGELLPLFGLFAALALGAQAFEAVGMKADLGALALGVLMSHHKRAPDVAEALFGLKEVFLVGFFLNIGLSGAPGLAGVLMALALLLVLPLKAMLFFAILTRFRMRARSSLLASFVLANFSEFGLICGAIGVENGWLDPQWLVIVALAVALSFALESPINAMAHDIYARFHEVLRRLESPEVHPEEAPILPGDADIVIFGMGRIGTGAYDHIRETLGSRVLGVEINQELVRRHEQAGRNVIVGDATDSDFWERTRFDQQRLRLIMLAMPEHNANMYAARRIAAAGSRYLIAAVAQFPDQVEQLKGLGVHAAYNTYAEAGAGFAVHVGKELREQLQDLGIVRRAAGDSQVP
jgi:glutathione-regulated potassium-efflux system ancillary protein KefC